MRLSVSPKIASMSSAIDLPARSTSVQPVDTQAPFTHSRCPDTQVTANNKVIENLQKQVVNLTNDNRRLVEENEAANQKLVDRMDQEAAVLRDAQEEMRIKLQTDLKNYMQSMDEKMQEIENRSEDCIQRERESRERTEQLLRRSKIELRKTEIKLEVKTEAVPRTTAVPRSDAIIILDSDNDDETAADDASSDHDIITTPGNTQDEPSGNNEVTPLKTRTQRTKEGKPLLAAKMIPY